MLLAPAEMTAAKNQKDAAQKCFDAVKLDPDMYRIGHTKARYFTILFPVSISVFVIRWLYHLWYLCRTFLHFGSWTNHFCVDLSHEIFVCTVFLIRIFLHVFPGIIRNFDYMFFDWITYFCTFMWFYLVCSPFVSAPYIHFPFFTFIFVLKSDIFIRLILIFFFVIFGSRLWTNSCNDFYTIKYLYK